MTARSPGAPRTGAVVVGYGAADTTLRCVDALVRSSPPLDLVVVDNAADGHLRDGLRARFPAVKYVPAAGNLGFGGGCNLGLAQLRDVDQVALVNNDVVVAPGWLPPLTSRLVAERAGAVVPKVRLLGAYTRVRLSSPVFVPGAGDPRPLGVQLSGVRVGGVDVLDRVELDRGFWGWEDDPVTVGGSFLWTDGDGVLLVPVAAEGGDLELRLSCPAGHGTDATAEVGGRTHRLALGRAPVWRSLGRASAGRPVLYGAGATADAAGRTADVGFLRDDDGTFDEARPVDTWSAAVVLLSRAFLDDVGAFDERLFLYFEDTDLAWRGRRRGWSYWYEPASVVSHEHGATVGLSSPLTRHLLRRNRLVVLTKNGRRTEIVRELASLAADVGRAAGRDVVARSLTGRRPHGRHAVALARVAVGYGRLLPGTLRRRWRRS